MPHPLYLITRYLKATGDNCEKCYKILDDHRGIFAEAKGSMHNHQAWPGGYLQHVADCIQIAQGIYNKFNMTAWPIPFSWSSVVLVLFLHDIEKPFMQEEQLKAGPKWKPWDKFHRLGFKMLKIAEYDIDITEEEKRAIVTIEGENDQYSPTMRVMNELGALCHAADILSARLWHSRGRPELP